MPESTTHTTLRRQRWAVSACLPLLNLVARWHHLAIEGDEHLPKEGPALLLVKHRATRDSLLLSHLLHQMTGRMANYLMKHRAAGLPPQFLELFGGIPVIRPKDILQLKTRSQRHAALRRARTMCEEAQAYVTWLYERGELVVTYPEGTFYPDSLGPLYTSAIRQVYDLTYDRELIIPIVPIGTVYKNQRGLRSHAFFNIGPPFEATAFLSFASLIKALREQLQILSDINDH